MSLSGEAIKKKSDLPLLLVLGFAFLGGMILNLMPCVFPVLGLKIMGFVSQAGEDTHRIKKHGLVFGAGVLLSMWALVVSLLLVKEFSGKDIIWGQQLREPWFVAAMIAVIFAFGLSLAGLFEFGASLTTAGGKFAEQEGLFRLVFLRIADGIDCVTLHWSVHGACRELCPRSDCDNNRPGLHSAGLRACVSLCAVELFSGTGEEVTSARCLDGNVQAVHGISDDRDGNLAGIGLWQATWFWRSDLATGSAVSAHIRSLDLWTLWNADPQNRNPVGRPSGAAGSNHWRNFHFG